MHRKKIFSIGIWILIFIIFFSIITLLCILFINTDDYLKVSSDQKGEYISYDGNNYYLYQQNGAQFVPEANETQYVLTPEPQRTKIGYSRNLYGKKFDAYMLDNSSENIIVTYTGINTPFLWLKDGFNLPNLFEAEIGSIVIKDLNEDRIVAWSDEKEFKTLKDFLIEEDFTTLIDKKMEKSVYFQLAKPNSLEFCLGLYVVDSALYLRIINDQYDNLFYKVREEVKYLFLL